MDPVAQRSRDMIAGVSELDARTAQALQDRSLERLHDIYRDLEKKSLDVEKLMSSGGNACGCDVAYASLLVAVGFAVNTLDGEGRYAPWMKIESLRLLDNYKSLANDCAVDAGRTGFNSRIQSQYIETR